MIAEGPALLLLLISSIGLVRLVYGPGPVDRMLVALLLGTTGAGVVLLLSLGEGAADARTVALVLVLLAAISGVAFVRRYVAAEPEEDPDD
ncbi:hypothetical protein AN478_04040 [Thiohalorhabdus denitrificans]|uniref:Multicomponent Na+:H+ antiporter subunit F n=1 Tax=Thiohalorhabdus denitrificans TaxID=381306 RepID=A0A0P9GLL6_9GAMM|nr:hypothetical protein [Thiohalorhabdus denitrificans]KPV41091.1 hypothetical protein AN478_04040 [Thiohalorhabdus denitrificans]SCY38816.1 multicomponent Na+:H+ antiporter subunit F [Thiohalorhabdus denitrificans]